MAYHKIIINNLSKSYNPKIKIFSHFNYIFSKQLYIITGRNGAGKSTLLNCIANYIRYNGTIQVNGKISYLPEKRNFDDDYKVKDLVNMLSKFYGHYPKSYLELFDLSKNMDKTIISLSNGNKTKLFILCTLMKPADIYLFDEPTNGLDLQMKEVFGRLCIELSKQKMVIISTHDRGLMIQLSKEAKVLRIKT